jgi:hypothetical protein
MQNGYKEPAKRPDGKIALVDMYAAGFLIAAGHRVLSAERIGERRHAFLFEPNDKIHVDYLKFINNEPVNVQDFVSGIYRLKRLLYDSDDRNGRK